QDSYRQEIFLMGGERLDPSLIYTQGISQVGLPVKPASLIHRRAVFAPTPKCTSACDRGIPPSTARRNFIRVFSLALARLSGMPASLAIRMALARLTPQCGPAWRHDIPLS